jgi:predicted nuclease with TOPRIM domain
MRWQIMQTDDKGQEREIERLNNRLSQIIAEIGRLNEALKLNQDKIRDLAVKSFEEGYILDVNDMRFSKDDTKVDFFADSIGWEFVEKVVVSK